MWTEEKKIKIGKFLRAVGFLLVLALLVNTLSHIFMRKDAEKRFSAFYEKPEQFDVLFLGTSHVVNGIQPMELWKDYGIASYNIGACGSPFPTLYHLLISILNDSQPKLLVFDCSKLASNYYINPQIDNAHDPWDAIPLSREKYLAFGELLEKTQNAGNFDGNLFLKNCSFLFPFTLYHNRWNSLTRDDFCTEIDPTFGYTALYNVNAQKEANRIPLANTLSEDTVGIEYFEKIISLCRERNIEVLLTYLPIVASAVKQQEANSAYQLAEKYGLNYLNFLDIPLVNFNTDFANNLHMNPSGARKVTEYIGQYILDTYDIEDHRDEALYSSWFDSYAAHTEHNVRMLQEQTNLDTYLMLLADKNLFSCVYVPQGSAILKNKQKKNLIANIPVAQELSLLETAAKEDTGYLLVNDPASGEVFECSSSDTLSINTSLGRLCFSLDETGKACLTIGDSTKNFLKLKNDTTSHDIQIACFYHDVSRVSDVAAYTVTKTNPLSTKKIN